MKFKEWLDRELIMREIAVEIEATKKSRKTEEVVNTTVEEGMSKDDYEETKLFKNNA